jgi:hypothetical protein
MENSKDYLTQVFQGVSYEDAQVLLKSYLDSNAKSNQMVTEMSKGLNPKDFDVIHDLAYEHYKKDFKKIQKATNNRKLGAWEFTEELNKTDSVISTGFIPAYQEVFSLYNYWQAGERDYLIHPNLCAKFNVSHVKSIPSEFLKLPFHSIRLVVPSGVMPYLTLDGRDISMRDITLTEFTDENLGGLNILVFMRFADDVGFFRIRLNKPEVHECLEESISRMSMFDNEAKLVFQDASDFTDKQKDLIRLNFDFVAKSILYITGAGSDVKWVDERPELLAQLSRAKSGGKRSKLERRLQKAKRMFLVGHSIVLSRQEREMYESKGEGTWRTSYRFIVQGHWRNQAHGPKMSQRKLIFIEPHYKGPSFTDVVNNPHVVK